MFNMNIFKEIKWGYQRVKYGYSDRDLWSFDDYLCDIIPPAIRNLKEQVSACPGDLYDKTIKNDECWKWKEILEEIAQGFEAAKDLTHLKYFKNVKKGKYYIRGIDKKRRKMLSKKHDRGMELFHKYFFALWD